MGFFPKCMVKRLSASYCVKLLYSEHFTFCLDMNTGSPSVLVNHLYQFICGIYNFPSRVTQSGKELDATALCFVRRCIVCSVKYKLVVWCCFTQIFIYIFSTAIRYDTTFQICQKIVHSTLYHVHKVDGRIMTLTVMLTFVR